MRLLTSSARHWLFLTVILGLSLLAIRPLHSLAEPVIQGFSSDSALPKGMVVRISKTDKTKVEAASADDLSKMFGVVVDANDAPITLTQSGQQVFVATQGKYVMLVSSENGAINTNDYISMSSSNGIAAKATASQAYIIGRAVEAFDGKTNTVSSSNGVGIGRIQVDMGVGKNPIQKADKNFLPAFLQKTANSIAGKPVPPARIYAGLVLVIVAGFVSGALLYAGVRNSLISIGRNPLGKKGIVRGLLQVVLISLIIFILGVFGVYLLVKL